MSHEAIERNSEERERLIALVRDCSDDDLAAAVGDVWAVSSALAHMAFWDQFARLLLERQLSGLDARIDAPEWRDDVLNDALLPLCRALDSRTAAQLAVDAATATDGRLAELSLATIEVLEADADDTRWLLRRHRHRAEHLDEIEQALAASARV